MFGLRGWSIADLDRLDSEDLASLVEAARKYEGEMAKQAREAGRG